MKELIINQFLDYEFVFIFLLFFLVFLLIAMFIKQKTIKKITFLLFSVFFILFVFEFVLSFFNNKAITDFHKEYINVKGICNLKKDKHIKILFNNQTYDFYNRNFDGFKDCSIVFNSEYTVYDNTSLRYTKCNKDSDQVYIFFGCSLIFGLGINDDETLPYYFSKKFNFEKNIINCGFSGCGTNTALNILNSNLFRYFIPKNSKVKHSFYTLIEDHIYRNFRYEHYSYCIDGYLYRNKKFYIPTTIGKVKYVFARSYIFRKVFVSTLDNCFQEYYELYMINSLKTINKIMEKRYNSKFTVIVYPGRYSENFIKKLQETNLDLIFLPRYFNSEENGYIIKYDGHPTPKANEEIAEILYNHINEQDKIN